MPKVYGEAFRHIRICVDSYEDGNPKGSYFHPAMRGGGAEFRSLSELLLGADDLMDRERFPQAFTARRSFLDAPELPGAELPEAGTQSGALATFDVRILFRQHSSWQGSVRWLEGRRETTFRSVLELTGLMDSALPHGKDTEVKA